MALRPTSNLKIPQELMLDRAAQKQKFLYVYTGAYVGTPTAFMTRLWTSVLFPSAVADPKFGSAKPRFAADELARFIPAGYLKVQKIKNPADPYFKVSVPLFSFSRSNTGNINTFLNNVMRNWRAEKTEVTPSPEHVQEQRDLIDRLRPGPDADLGDHVWPAAQVVQAMKLDMVSSKQLMACLLQVRIQTKGPLAVIFADFKVTKEEAQQLTTTPWTELRDIDLYPLLLHWITVGFGARGIAPTASFSVSKIAFTLPKSHVDEARVDSNGISIGPDGKPYFLPREVEKSQTLAYEDAYTQAGAREDGTFALLDINEGALAMESGKEAKTRLPANMVVSVDWLNNKYAYTDASGFLTVKDLTRFRVANVSHIRQLLDHRSLQEKTYNWFFNMGAAVGVENAEFVVLAKDLETQDPHNPVSDSTRSKLAKYEKDPIGWLETAIACYMEDTGAVKVTYGDLGHCAYAPFAPVRRFLARIEAAVQNNISVVYTKYSVSTVSSQFAWLVLVTKYATNLVAVRASDDTRRKAALTQGVDPNWEMPSVPLISTHMGPDHDQPVGLLPHQAKIQNLMKDDPEIAILPVQAGGGKTPSLLIDLLLKLKAGTDAPYLVLCPLHLVPNYVKETVYFTDGKLNVIPLTNMAVRQNGFDRLQEIFEAAPRNTVVVADLDYVLSFRQRVVSYGTTPTSVYPTIEFLRQFRFGYVAIDEAHKIKGDSGKNRAVMQLIADIPKKRLASGTFVHDSPSDLARIIGALDPTIFGTRDEFNATYGEETRGDRVTKWRPGAEREIMKKLSEHVVIAGAMRKEWAAFLPTKVESTFGVTLSHSQQAVYEDILNKTIEKIQQDAKTNAALQKFLNPVKKGPADPSKPGSADDVDDDDRDIDEDAGEDIAGALNPYLERLETFLVAPGSDELGSKLLKGDDLLSPKVSVVYDRIRLHIHGGMIDVPEYEELTDVERRAGIEPRIIGMKKEQYGPFPGKILVFCNSHKAADAIFDNAPADLKKMGVLYKASSKVEALSQMEKDATKLWMVGIVKSMEEGLNLQFASRIIRVSAPWNPGSLEQSNSRIERPEFKKEETRSKVFFDTIVANHTYDITKQARLIAKVLAAAKFENVDSPTYQTIPDLEVLPMNLDTIREFNSWQGDGTPENPGLVQYMRAQKLYEKVRNADYAKYKADYIAKNGSGPVLKAVPVAPTPDDARMLKIVPYVPGLGVYKESELGLQRLDEFLNVSSGTEADDDDENGVDDESNLTPQQREIAEKARSLIGRYVHTEYGEGYLSGVSPTSPRCTVKLLNGHTISKIRKSQVFLVSRALTNNKDIRNAILRETGIPVLDNTVSVPALFWNVTKYTKKELKQQELLKKQQEKVTTPGKHPLKEQGPKTKVKPTVVKEEKKGVEVRVFVANGYLGLDFDTGEDVDLGVIKTFQASGFRPTQPYFYSEVKNNTALNNQMKLWKEVGLMVDSQMMKLGVREAFIEMFNLLKSGMIRSHKETYRVARANQMVNFYKMENKPSNEKSTFKPYPIIQDGKAFIALPANQASSKTAMQHKRPAFRWFKSEPALTYFGTLQQVVHKLQEIQADGVQITNIKDIETELHKMKQSKMQIRDPKADAAI